MKRVAPACVGVLSLLMTVAVTGCMDGSAQAARQRLAQHPIQEGRMSTRAEDGYKPCGVWRVRGARNVVYLVATSHVVGADQIPLPSPFYAAYQDSQEIYVEMDPTVSPFAMLGLFFKMVKWTGSHQADLCCPKGRRLGDYLDPNTAAHLRGFYGKGYSKKEFMTPLFLLLDHEILGAGQGDEAGGVEDVFALQARKDHKRIRALDEQSTTDLALQTLDDLLMDLKHEIARRGADAVIQDKIISGNQDKEDDEVWRRGDLVSVEGDLEKMKAESPDLYEKVLPDRNRRWLQKLQGPLQGKKNLMVLVGVAHMAGSEGLLQMLRESGFTVEQLYGVDRPIPPLRSQSGPCSQASPTGAIPGVF